jgi:hypothetical protein
MAPPSVFREAAKPKQSDMDVCKGSNAKAILEQHWDSWIIDEDWNWIKEHGYNSVRIPVSIFSMSLAVVWKEELIACVDWFLPFMWSYTGCIEEDGF